VGQDRHTNEAKRVSGYVTAATARRGFSIWSTTTSPAATPSSRPSTASPRPSPPRSSICQPLFFRVLLKSANTLRLTYWCRPIEEEPPCPIHSPLFWRNGWETPKPKYEFMQSKTLVPPSRIMGGNVLAQFLMAFCHLHTALGMAGCRQLRRRTVFRVDTAGGTRRGSLPGQVCAFALSTSTHPCMAGVQGWTKLKAMPSGAPLQTSASSAVTLHGGATCRHSTHDDQLTICSPTCTHYESHLQTR